MIELAITSACPLYTVLSHCGISVIWQAIMYVQLDSATLCKGIGVITLFRKPPAPLVRTNKALPFFNTSTKRKRVNHPHFRYPLACASSLYVRPLLGAFLKPPALPVVTHSSIRQYDAHHPKAHSHRLSP